MKSKSNLLEADVDAKKIFAQIYVSSFVGFLFFCSVKFWAGLSCKMNV